MATDCLLAGIYVAQKNLDKARPLTEKALNLSRRMPLEKCALSAGNLSRLGWDYLEQGDLAQADILCDLAWQAMRRNPAFNPVGSPSIIVQLGAVYRHKPTGRFMILDAADIGENTIELLPIGDPWAGSSQDFKKEFELMAPFSPANASVEQPRPQKNA